MLTDAQQQLWPIVRHVVVVRIAMRCFTRRVQAKEEGTTMIAGDVTIVMLALLQAVMGKTVALSYRDDVEQKEVMLVPTACSCRGAHELSLWHDVAKEGKTFQSCSFTWTNYCIQPSKQVKKNELCVPRLKQVTYTTDGFQRGFEHQITFLSVAHGEEWQRIAVKCISVDKTIWQWAECLTRFISSRQLDFQGSSAEWVETLYNQHKGE